MNKTLLLTSVLATAIAFALPADAQRGGAGLAGAVGRMGPPAGVTGGAAGRVGGMIGAPAGARTSIGAAAGARGAAAATARGTNAAGALGAAAGRAADQAQQGLTRAQDAVNASVTAGGRAATDDVDASADATVEVDGEERAKGTERALEALGRAAERAPEQAQKGLANAMEKVAAAGGADVSTDVTTGSDATVADDTDAGEPRGSRQTGLDASAEGRATAEAARQRRDERQSEKARDDRPRR